jgi:hypothetical protein
MSPVESRVLTIGSAEDSRPDKKSSHSVAAFWRSFWKMGFRWRYR